MARFCFITVWRIEAPLAAVCDAVSRCQHWPQWWPAVQHVRELLPGDEQGIGSVRHFTWKGPLPYQLRFDVRVTQIVPHTLLEGWASGEVEGMGRWRFADEGGITVVQYEWDVRTNRQWMTWLAPLAWPLFKWNHDRVMRQGAEGMARLLNARLLSLTHGGVRQHG